MIEYDLNRPGAKSVQPDGILYGPDDRLYLYQKVLLYYTNPQSRRTVEVKVFREAQGKFVGARTHFLNEAAQLTTKFTDPPMFVVPGVDEVLDGGVNRNQVTSLIRPGFGFSLEHTFSICSADVFDERTRETSRGWVTRYFANPQDRVSPVGVFLAIKSGVHTFAPYLKTRVAVVYEEFVPIYVLAVDKHRVRYASDGCVYTLWDRFNGPILHRLPGTPTEERQQMAIEYKYAPSSSTALPPTCRFDDFDVDPSGKFLMTTGDQVRKFEIDHATQKLRLAETYSWGGTRVAYSRDGLTLALLSSHKLIVVDAE